MNHSYTHCYIIKDDILERFLYVDCYVNADFAPKVKVTFNQGVHIASLKNTII